MLSKFSNFQLLLILSIFVLSAIAVKIYDSQTIDYADLPGVNDLDFGNVASVPPDQEHFNGVVVPANYDNWKRLAFTLPDEKSHEVVKVLEGWTSNGELVNPDSLTFLLSRMVGQKGKKIITGIETWRLKNPDYVLFIYDTDDEEICKITTYTFWERGEVDPSKAVLILTSSLNPGVLFDARSDSLLWKFFPGKRRFN